VVQFGGLMQGCEILTNPLFYYTKFGEELDFKVRYEFPPSLSFLKEKIIISACEKKRKKHKREKFKEKKRNGKKRTEKRRKQSALAGKEVIFDFRLFISSFGDLF